MPKKLPENCYCCSHREFNLSVNKNLPDSRGSFDCGIENRSVSTNDCLHSRPKWCPLDKLNKN